MKNTSKLIAAHQAEGRFFEAGAVKSFARIAGSGEAVVCLHGVPASSYLYRKVLAELAQQGLQGIAFDFPGMGLAERPKEFDYSWTGLGRWTQKAIEALGVESFHLVVHDIGGPIGMELVAHQPERIKSLTILNTVIAGVGSFKKPWVMRPFEKKRVGELYLGTLTPRLFVQLMYMQGVLDKQKAPAEELAAYVELLKGSDGGKAFLKIMRNFEATPQKERLYLEALKKLTVPIQVIWGINDPALPYKQYGMPLKEAAGIETFFTVPAKHFLQEDQAVVIAEKIAEQAASLHG